MKDYYVYILVSKKNGTIYIGVTANLKKRVYEHKFSKILGFSSKYKIKDLVYFEIFNNIENAILREKRLKSWKRQWKIDLIEKGNPYWEDLYSVI